MAGWKGLFVETYFDSYVEEQLENLMFKDSLEEKVSKEIENSGLKEMLTSISEEISKLRNERHILSLRLNYGRG